MIVRRRPTRIVPAVLAATLVAAALLPLLGAGCTERPADPAWDNPFDPLGPAGGDPWNLQARYVSNYVFLTWSQPDFADLAEVVVLRSLDGVTFTQEAGRATPPTASFQDTGYEPYATNYYRVYATDSYGNASYPSRVAVASADAAAQLEIAGGATSTPTRYVELNVRGAAQGDTLEIAANGLFTGSLLQPVVTDDDEQVVDWDLGTAAASGERKRVWLRVRPLRAGWPAARDSITVEFPVPDLQATGRPASVAARRLTVDFPAAGLVEARFAAGLTTAAARLALPGAGWVEPDSVAGTLAYYTADLLLPGGTDPQWLFGEFRCDFEFSRVDSLLVAPDDLADATFVLAGGAATTTDLTVTIASQAVATQMRFAESPDLSGVAWLPYAAASEFTLSAGAGLKTVYGQYRNDWAQSPAVVRTITFVQTK